MVMYNILSDISGVDPKIDLLPLFANQIHAGAGHRVCVDIGRC